MEALTPHILPEEIPIYVKASGSVSITGHFNRSSKHVISPGL